MSVEGGLGKKHYPIEELVGKDLSGFRIKQMVKIYEVNEDGNPVQTIGILEDETLAKGWIRVLGAKVFYTKWIHVLTDGNVAIEIGCEIKILDPQQILQEVKNFVQNTLPPEFSELLGLTTEVAE